MNNRLLIEEPPLQVLPSLAMVIGLNEAIVLQQVHYWLNSHRRKKSADHYREGAWWVYNTYEQWQANNFPFWSLSTVKRIFAALEKTGILRADNFSKDPLDHTKWYTIDYGKLNDLTLDSPLAQIEPIEEGNTARSGQVDPIHHVKLTQSIGSNWTDASGQLDPMIYGTETTTETTQKEKPLAENSDEFSGGAASLPLADFTPETITPDQLRHLTLPQIVAWVKSCLETAPDDQLDHYIELVLEKEQAGKARKSLPDDLRPLVPAEWLRRNLARYDQNEMVRLIANALDLPLGKQHGAAIGNYINRSLWCYPDPYTPEEVAGMIAVKDAQPKDRDWRRYMTYGNFATNMGKYRSWKARKGHTPNGRSASAPQAGRPAGRPDYDALVEQEQTYLATRYGVPAASTNSS